MRAILIMALLALPLPAAEVRTPAVGSKERTDILDAIRDPLEDYIHQEVTFRVSHLKVQDGWAFLIAEARTKDDKPIDYTGTIFESDAKEWDEGVIAILRHKRGRWYVVNHSFFASDVWWHGADKELRAPAAIFPAPSAD
jgi:hypothetical protein